MAWRVCSEYWILLDSRAEQWGVFDGLNLAWDKGFRKVIVEVGSKLVIDVVHNKELGSSCSRYSSSYRQRVDGLICA